MVDINTSANNPRLALECAYVLQQLRVAPFFDNLTAEIQGIFGPGAVGTLYPLDDIVPRMGMWIAPNYTLIALDGLTTSDQVGVAVLGWIEGRRQRGIQGFSRTCVAVSNIVEGRMDFQDGLRNDRIILTGYSYGGMCLNELAARLANARNSRTVSLLTFGSPKPGDDRILQAMLRVDAQRYINDGDNVTFCPPMGYQALLMHLLLSRGESQSVNELIQWPFGSVLSPTGGITQATYPTEAGLFTDLTIANFLYSNEAPVAQAHFISEYVRRLTICTEQNPPQPQRQRGAADMIGAAPGVVQPPQPVIPAEITPVMQAMPNAGDAPVNALPARPPLRMPFADEQEPVEPQGIQGPPRPSRDDTAYKPYKAKKTGRVWVVFFETQARTLMICTGKQQAKRMASRLNSALRIWDSVAAGDEQAFEQSVIDAFN